MNTIKKLLITLSIALLITLGLEHSAYASDITYSLEAGEASDIVTTVSADDKKTEELDIEDKDIERIDSSTLDSEAYDIESLGTEGLEAESLDEDYDPNNLEATDSDEDFNPEEIELEDISIEDIDLDKYDVFFDEQGQMYIALKEPEVVEPEKVEVKKSAEKKEKKPAYSEKDLRLLASLVYAEAGNQSYKGMLAVANVVLNRVKSDVYSHVKTIEQVIYDRKWAVQFSVTVENKKTGISSLDRALELYDTGKIKCKNPEAERQAMKKAIKAAKAALEGENNIGKYLCFRMNNKGASSIKKKYKYIILGDHIFYRTK
ncbi:MAG: cell wall hydrolase [Clostridiales bacterium]|nr:cell wall hydrolase [Clostridiales bacterium]